MHGKSILEILEEHDISYSLSGSVYTCLCPFHNDINNPSMVIFPESNSFYCFTCQAGSKPEHLIMQLDGISKQEAMEIVYGEDYLSEYLLTDGEIPDTSLYLNVLVSEYLRKYYINSPEYMSLVKEIDSTKITNYTLQEILNKITTFWEKYGNT